MYFGVLVGRYLVRCGPMWSDVAVNEEEGQTTEWRPPVKIKLGDTRISEKIPLISKSLSYLLSSSNYRHPVPEQISAHFGVKACGMRGRSWCGGFPIPAIFLSSEPSAEAPSAREQTERCISITPISPDFVH